MKKKDILQGVIEKIPIYFQKLTNQWLCEIWKTKQNITS